MRTLAKAASLAVLLFCIGVAPALAEAPVEDGAVVTVKETVELFSEFMFDFTNRPLKGTFDHRFHLDNVVLVGLKLLYGAAGFACISL